MKKLTYYLVIACTMCGIMSLSPKPTANPERAEPITFEMLNCKNGLYRTYEDLKKGKAEPYEYQYVFGKHPQGLKEILEYQITFKDADGKKVKMNGKDFWGWKTDVGLYRTLEFPVDKITHIAARVEYVSTTSVSYMPLHTEVDIFETGGGLYSIDLKEAVYPKEKFKKKYSLDDTKLRACMYPYPSPKPPKGVNQYYYWQTLTEKCPDLLFIQRQFDEKGRDTKFPRHYFDVSKK